MSEPGLGDHIILNYSMTVSLARALIGVGVLDPSDIAAACRTTAENMSPDGVRTHLLAFTETLEEAEAGAERLLTPGWTPEVVPGDKDGGGKDDGDA
ncbi:MAG: hypothetical protein V3U93_05910 [Alphaproteobacteria bacterium]